MEKEYDKSEGIDPCPLCNGRAELLSCWRGMKQVPSMNKEEIVCLECGLTLKCDRSSHKARKKWNTRSNKELGIVPMPKDYIGAFYNSNGPCDMVIGPCACGATHTSEDWVQKKGSFEQKDIRHVATSDGEHPDEKTENVMFVWSIDGFGFGTTTFFYDDGKLKCDNEAMSKDSIKKILCEFVDKAEFVG